MEKEMKGDLGVERGGRENIVIPKCVSMIFTKCMTSKVKPVCIFM